MRAKKLYRACTIIIICRLRGWLGKNVLVAEPEPAFVGSGAESLLHVVLVAAVNGLKGVGVGIRKREESEPAGGENGGRKKENGERKKRSE
jgi:hypothetical protein